MTLEHLLKAERTGWQSLGTYCWIMQESNPGAFQRHIENAKNGPKSLEIINVADLL